MIIGDNDQGNRSWNLSTPDGMPIAREVGDHSHRRGLFYPKQGSPNRPVETSPGCRLALCPTYFVRVGRCDTKPLPSHDVPF